MFRHLLPDFRFCKMEKLFLPIKGEGTPMASLVETLLIFVVALIISTVIIFVIVRFFGEKESISTAILAALIGTIIYTAIYSVLGQGLIAAFVAGIAWLLALQVLYKIGWIKSLVIAIFIWIITSIAGWFLPTLTGPL
jgi:hypothetical protein